MREKIRKSGLTISLNAGRSFIACGPPGRETHMPYYYYSDGSDFRIFNILNDLNKKLQNIMIDEILYKNQIYKLDVGTPRIFSAFRLNSRRLVYVLPDEHMYEFISFDCENE